MIQYYSPDGQPIDMADAMPLFADGDARRVAHTTITTDRGRVEVSTVFLVIDHSFSRTGPPVLWESLVFGGPEDQDMRRYRSRAEAETGHVEVVALTRTAMELDGATILAEESFTPSDGESSGEVASTP